MERREFIKTSCSACLALGAGFIVGELSSCARIPVYNTIAIDRAIEVPRSLFADGSVHIVRAKDLEYDIAVQKRNDGSYLAVLLCCTHADNPLDFDGTGFRCSLHGSTFDGEGAVTHGPAAHPLKRLLARVSNDKVIIRL